MLERARIGDLPQERQIIRANREGTVGPNGKQLPPLGPILNAGIIFEGDVDMIVMWRPVESAPSA